MKVQLPFHKGEVRTATVDDLTYAGNGVVKVDDYPIFVPNALPGEEVALRVTKTARHFAWGRVEKRLTSSPDRVKVANRAYLQSGAAPLAILKYSAQLKFKQHQIEELLAKAHLDIPVKPTLGMDQPDHYRNKAQVPVRMIHGKLQTGFYKRGSHQLMPVDDYLIQEPQIDSAIKVVRDLLRRYQVPAYNEKTGKGVIRTIMVRRGYYSHQMMIVLVTNTPSLGHAEAIVQGIQDGVPEVKSIIQNINSRKTNVILGKKDKVLWGQPVIHDTLLGIDFAISPLSFYQVNP